MSFYYILQCSRNDKIYAFSLHNIDGNNDKVAIINANNEWDNQNLMKKGELVKVNKDEDDKITETKIIKKYRRF